MTDITDTHLEAAFLDQKVAGIFHDKAYAFVAIHDGTLGVAVANERGYCPITGPSISSYDEAKTWAKSLNKHIGLSEDDAALIVISTMGGRRYTSHKGS
jgi:hypothetical protein